VELYCDDLDIACIRLMANRDTLRLWEMTAEEIVRREHIASIRAAVRLAADRLLQNSDYPLA
jgi:hypothetical protein